MRRWTTTRRSWAAGGVSSSPKPASPWHGTSADGQESGEEAVVETWEQKSGRVWIYRVPDAQGALHYYGSVVRDPVDGAGGPVWDAIVAGESAREDRTITARVTLEQARQALEHAAVAQGGDVEHER